MQTKKLTKTQIRKPLDSSHDIIAEISSEKVNPMAGVNYWESQQKVLMSELVPWHFS